MPSNLRHWVLLVIILWGLALLTRAEEPVGLAVSPCPAEFQHLPLHPTARLCQPYTETMPASLVYHADTIPANVVQFYIDALGRPDKQNVVSGRTMLQFAQGKHTIIVSKDGSGSQIDVLVK